MCNAIRATMWEAGLRVQPNLSRYTVTSIVQILRQEHGWETYLLSTENPWLTTCPISTVLVSIPVSFYNKLQ